MLTRRDFLKQAGVVLASGLAAVVGIVAPKQQVNDDLGFTAEPWFRSPGWGDARRGRLDKVEKSIIGTWDPYFMFPTHADGSLIEVPLPDIPDDGKPHQVAVQWNSVSRTAYIDGEFVGSFTAAQVYGR